MGSHFESQIWGGGVDLQFGGGELIFEGGLYSEAFALVIFILDFNNFNNFNSY